MATVGFVIGILASIYWYCSREEDSKFFPVAAIFVMVTPLLCFLIERYHGYGATAWGYLFFAVTLFVSAITDAMESWVDTWVIILGILLVAICKWLSGDLVPALVGAGVGAIVVTGWYLIGNKSMSCRKIDAATSSADEENAFLALKLPFVPSLTLAVIVHALSDKGLANFFLELLYYMSSEMSYMGYMVLIGVIILLLVYRQRQSGHMIVKEENCDEFEVALGSGDIIVAVLIGVAIGWENLLAVLFLGCVIFVYHGVATYMINSFYIAKKEEEKSLPR